jgi:hypothetical protein
MIWSTVGTAYERIFARAVLPVLPPPKPLAKLAAVGG